MEVVQGMIAAMPCSDRLNRGEPYVQLPLKELKLHASPQVVVYSDVGFATSHEPDEPLKAICYLHGTFEKTVENMNQLRSRSTIDFEGLLRPYYCVEKTAAKLDDEIGEVVPVDDAPFSEPGLVYRLDGVQSPLFSRIEELLLIVPSTSRQRAQKLDDLVFEKITRVEVAQEDGAEPHPLHRVMLKSANNLGEGVLIWPSYERKSDRYGFICLLREPSEGSEHVMPALDGLLEKHGSLVCEVIETRKSNLIDFFRGFYATTPQRGELIWLGQGCLATGEDGAVGLLPSDGREIDWMNPESLYRCHLQTVRLWFIPTEAEQQDFGS